MISTTFDSCTATIGGAIALNNGQSDPCKIKDSVFSNNHAISFGGAIYSSVAGLHIGGTTFNSNVAQAFGGGVYANMHLEDVVMRDTTFESNAADGGNGGGAFLARSFAHFKRVNFNGNTATEGGGLFIGSDGFENAS